MPIISREPVMVLSAVIFLIITGLFSCCLFSVSAQEGPDALEEAAGTASVPPSADGGSQDDTPQPIAEISQVQAPVTGNGIGPDPSATAINSEPIVLPLFAPSQSDSQGIVMGDEAAAAESSAPSAINPDKEASADETDPAGSVAASEASETAADGDQPAQHSVTVNSFIARKIPTDKLGFISAWIMDSAKDPDGGYAGKDDSRESGAALLPQGRYGSDKRFAVCGLLAGAQKGIASISAAVRFPENTSLIKNGAESACGREKTSLELRPLDKEEAISLFCGSVRQENNNLPIWNSDKQEGYVYGYEQICGDSGALSAGDVSAYCGEADLAFDDPAGYYPALFKALGANAETAELEAGFKYLELTVFENDFSDIQYGPARADEWEDVPGDAEFGTAEAPTIRNIGNTRLRAKIRQNDFGFGRGPDDWHIVYRARTGQKAKFTEYRPDATVLLDDPVLPGISASIDFSVMVKKFPAGNLAPSWKGELTILAEKAPFDICLDNN